MNRASNVEEDRPPMLLLDTHALIWLMAGDARLGKKAHWAIESASLQDQVAISAITPWEIGLLASKKRIELHQDSLEWIRAALARLGVNLVALDPEIAVESTRLPFEMHPDPANRILVATARHLGATLVTADESLLRLAKKGHFRALDASK